MSSVTITASSAGFFNLSPLGTAVAPNVFTQTGVNISGQIIGTKNCWETAESAMYADFGIDVSAQLGTEVAKLGAVTEVTVTGLKFYRIEGGEKIITAILTLPDPLILNATYDQTGPDAYGWLADMGDALENVLQAGFAFIGGAGDDIFNPHTQMLPAYGENVLKGRDGDDHLTGGLGDDRIYGGTGDDALTDASGTNRLIGGRGDDTITLGDYSDHSIAKGGRGNDLLISGNGSDRLKGGTGNDVLIGGHGNDRLKGGTGADHFVFNTNDRGHDRIKDFTDDEDLMIFHELNGFDDLTLQQKGANTLISWGTDSDILLKNVAADTLDASDFLFV